MTPTAYAIVTVLAWGLWLAPSQTVPLKGQQTRTFYVTLAALLMAVAGALVQGVGSLTALEFWLPFAGGIIWAISGWSAFVGVSHIGMAKAFGIWAPLNILVSIAWGMILFGEFLSTSAVNLALGAGSVVVIVAGILLIVFAGESAADPAVTAKRKVAGYVGALGAGVGFASYFCADPNFGTLDVGRDAADGGRDVRRLLPARAALPLTAEA